MFPMHLYNIKLTLHLCQVFSLCDGHILNILINFGNQLLAFNSKHSKLNNYLTERNKRRWSWTDPVSLIVWQVLDTKYTVDEHCGKEMKMEKDIQ